MAAHSSELRRLTGCRVLVGGFGLPGLRDLDFGRHFIDAVEHYEWPHDVVVEDLSYSAHLVLHRLQELRPQKLLLVGAATRELNPPGTIRRYRPSLVGASGDVVHDRLVAAISGEVDVDHTLTILRHWGALPADTVVIEVEPEDASLGPGFSAQLAAAIDPVLEMVHEELGRARSADDTPMVNRLRAVGRSQHPRHPEGEERVGEAGEAWGCRVPDSGSATGVAVAGRVRAWGDGADGGVWYDVMALGEGWIGVAIGDVTGRGTEVAGVMHQLRGATRAFASVYGTRPAEVLAHLDRLAASSAIGEMTTLLYLALHVPSGSVRLSNAGHCPPLVLAPNGTAAFFEEGRSVPLGAVAGVDRPEVLVPVALGWTFLLFTDGLVESRQRGLTEGLAQLRRAAVDGPPGLEDLCDHVLAVCQNGAAGDDDVALLAVRHVP